MSAEEAFRDELRAWLTEHPPPVLMGRSRRLVPPRSRSLAGIEFAATPEDAERVREWHRTLHSGGWVGIHWPVEYGGRGASVLQVAIYNQELARVNAPPLLGRAGISLVGPTLMTHGTEEQRRRWMPRMLAGDDVWCQLFSEPDAGSDLASLSTRAEKRGGVYVVTGQKVWSTYASFANWGIALVRTDPAVPQHLGISMLAIPMDAPGVEVRPLRQITGENEFNEIFLDGVEVPVEYLIGDEHDGWRVANTTLANERGASFIWREQVLHERAIDQLVATCRERGLTGDPRVRQDLARSWIDVQIFRYHNARTLERLARGDEVGAESSLVKLFYASLSQRMHAVATSTLGPDALLMPGADGAVDDGRWAHGLLWSRAMSIMGGTSEIQRNIVGERLLGLPREPR